MIPVLITGGTPKQRLKKAHKISNFEFRISNFDLILLDSPISIGIDEVRNLRKKLGLKPQGLGPKVALINNAQNLTVEAQNAFLKTLEEPPKNSQIILTAPTAEVLLPTVVSRCQIINLPLKSQVFPTKEKISQFRNFLISLFSSSSGERLKKIEELGLANDRQKAIEWVDIQTVVVRELLLTEERSNLPQGRTSLLNLLTIFRSLSQTKKYLQANVNIRLVLDNFVLYLPDNSVLKSS